jgi:hypothetical protein
MEKPRPETAVLPLVVDDHRHLGVVLAGPAVIASDADDLAVDLGHHRLVEMAVEAGQMEERGPTWLGHGGEEAVVDRLR